MLLCMVLCIDSYIFGAQIAAVAKIASLAHTQIYYYCMFCLRNNPACFFGVEFFGSPILTDGYIT